MLDIKQLTTANISGRGSLRSMPMEFSADLNTGAVQAIVALDLSPSRALTPKLALSYHVNQGNSVFGIGCDLNGILSISRSTRKGVPSYDDALDTFILGNQGELVKTEVSADASIVYYRPRVDNNFSVIEYHVTEKYWLLREANGINHYLGMDESSRVSEGDVNIFQWWVNRSEDACGNLIQYTYTKAKQEFYLQRIDYGNYQEVSGKTGFVFYCQFDYGDDDAAEKDHTGHPLWVKSAERPDQFTHYQAGFAFATRTLCRRILLYHYFNGQERLAKYWELNYKSSPVLSLIYSIQEIACRANSAGAYFIETLPPAMFDYTTINNAGSMLSPFDLESVALPQAEGTYQWVDLYRDGLPGILYHDGSSALYWRSESNGKFSAPKTVSPYIKEASFAGSLQARIMLLGEEKQTAFVVSDDEEVSYYFVYEEKLSDSGDHYQPFFSGENKFKRLPFAFVNPMSDIIDVNGDGRNDLVLLNDTYPHFYPELETAGEGYGPQKPLDLPKDFPRYGADAYAFVGFVDIFGDGLLHRVKVTQDGIDIWPNVGHGKFLAKVHWELPPIAGVFDPACLFFADIDGSGASDFVYATSDFLLVFLNQGNRFHAEPLRLQFPEKYTYQDKLLLGDFLGKGMSSVVFIKRDVKENHYYMGSFATHKPYLLSRLTTSTGLQTEFRYTTTTANALLDRSHVSIRLPFVLPILQESIATDLASHVTVSKKYNYHHGVYDFIERRFCGFAYVEEKTAETLTAHDMSVVTGAIKNSLIKRWFYNRAYREAEDRQEKFILSEWLDNDIAEPLYYKESEDSARKPVVLAKVADKKLARELAYCLNGRVLKVEQWEEKEEIPFSVHIMNYQIRCDQQPTENSVGVFVVQNRQSYELIYASVADEPRISRQLNMRFDAYNHVLESLKINYGRRSPLTHESVLLDDVRLDDKTTGRLDVYQRKQSVLLQCNSYTAVNGSDFSFLHVSAGSQQYDLSNAATGITSSNSLQEINAWYAGSVRELIYYVCYYYWDDRQESASELGSSGKRALLHHQQMLVGSALQMHDWYQPLLQSSETMETLLRTCGYVSYADDWWKPGLVLQYGSAEQYYQVIAIVSMAASTEKGLFHRTEVQRDKYQLCIERALQYLDTEGIFTDELLFDYQTLQLFRIIDHNQNIQLFLRDGFGRIIAQTKYGQCEGHWVGNPVTKTPHVPLTREQLAELSFEMCEQHGAMGMSEMIASAQSVLGSWLHMNYYHSDPASRCVVELVRHTYTNPIRPLIAKGTSSVGVSIYYLDGRDNILQTKHKTYHSESSRSWLGSGVRVYSHEKLLLWQSLPLYSETADRDSTYLTRDPHLFNYYDIANQLVRQSLPDGNSREWQRASWYELFYDQNAALKKQNPAIALPAANVLRFYNGLGSVVGYLTIQSMPEKHQYSLTTAHYDVLGRVIAQQDARLECPNLIVHYDLSGKVIARESVDRGVEYYVYNYQNTLVRKRLGEWSQLYKVDSWQRPISASVYSATSPLTEIEQRVYGESVADSAQRNACGQVIEYSNEEGMLRGLVFDLSGHCLHHHRHVFLPKMNARIHELMREDAAPHSWSHKAGSDVWQEEVFSCERQYNAVGQLVGERLPNGALGLREYNGLLQLEKIQMGADSDELTVVAEDMQYHAAGFRTDWRYGNGLVTHHDYDAIAQRLTGIRTQSMLHHTVQDQHYEFDPVGNIMRMQCGALQLATSASSVAMFPEHALQYAYDDLYRLSVAQGVELRHQGILPNHKNIIHERLGEDGAIHVYTQRFAYDTGDNLTNITHEGINPWTLDFAVEKSSNRFSHLTDIKSKAPLLLEKDALYDAAGNMQALDESTRLQWDHTNQLRHVSTKEETSADKVEEYYAYRGRAFQEVGFIDSAGAQARSPYTPGFFGKAAEKQIDTKPFAEYANRLYKITCFEKATGIEIIEQVFLGNYERKHVFTLAKGETAARLILSRHSVRAAEEDITFATWHQFEKDEFLHETSNAVTRDVWQYPLADHLHSSCVECDEKGFVTSAEVYQPYGQRSFVMTRDLQQLQIKDYHYSGQMRDKITGFYYYGARYYAPQFGRWLSPDPAGLIDTLNLYAFVGGGPLTKVDNFGFEAFVSPVSLSEVFGYSEYNFKEDVDKAAETGMKGTVVVGAGLVILGGAGGIAAAGELIEAGALVQGGTAVAAGAAPMSTKWLVATLVGSQAAMAGFAVKGAKGVCFLSGNTCPPELDTIELFLDVLSGGAKSVTGIKSLIDAKTSLEAAVATAERTLSTASTLLKGVEMGIQVSGGETSQTYKQVTGYVSAASNAAGAIDPKSSAAFIASVLDSAKDSMEASAIETKTTGKEKLRGSTASLSSSQLGAPQYPFQSTRNSNFFCTDSTGQLVTCDSRTKSVSDAARR